MRTFPLITALMMLATFAGARQSFEPEVISLIEIDVGENCWVKPLERDNWLIGNNGFWMERWTIDSCSGQRVYSVRYWPPDAFPNRDSPFEVVRVSNTARRPA